MDVKEILTLVKELDQSSLVYLDYSDDVTSLTLAKEMPKAPKASVETTQPEKEQITTPKTETPTEQVVEPVEEASSDDDAREVTAPLIGVAYLQPKPDEPPYIKVGDHVNKGDVIMILEAMKLMNEIQSTESGIVTEILVENEEVVEYGQPLIRVK